MSSKAEQKLLKQFGANIAATRKSKGVTQQMLAEKTGMSVVIIAYIE
ncbi:MAG: helix-turn-helix domain-containing protein, partial [Candidatus Saccharimonadales bacterium]